MSDLNPALTGTERTFGLRQIQAGHALMMVLSRELPFPIGEVWAAVSEPDSLEYYFGRPEGDLRRGGTYELPDGTRGGILRCDPPRLLTVSVTRPHGYAAELEMHLSAEESVTHVELRYASVRKRFALMDPHSEEWAAGPGWEFFLDCVVDYLNGVSFAEPVGIIGWTSLEGRQRELYEARNAVWEQAKSDYDSEHESRPGPQ